MLGMLVLGREDIILTCYTISMAGKCDIFTLIFPPEGDSPKRAVYFITQGQQKSEVYLPLDIYTGWPKKTNTESI